MRRCPEHLTKKSGFAGESELARKLAPLEPNKEQNEKTERNSGIGHPRFTKGILPDETPGTWSMGVVRRAEYVGESGGQPR